MINCRSKSILEFQSNHYTLHQFNYNGQEKAIDIQYTEGRTRVDGELKWIDPRQLLYCNRVRPISGGTLKRDRRLRRYSIEIIPSSSCEYTLEMRRRRSCKKGRPAVDPSFSSLCCYALRLNLFSNATHCSHYAIDDDDDDHFNDSCGSASCSMVAALEWIDSGITTGEETRDEMRLVVDGMGIWKVKQQTRTIEGSGGRLTKNLSFFVMRDETTIKKSGIRDSFGRQQIGVHHHRHQSSCQPL